MAPPNLFDLDAALPLLISKAASWAEARSAEIARSGEPLDETTLALARSVGVSCPERIRILDVARMPFPDDPVLGEAATAMGMLGEGTLGLTLGHGVWVRRGYRSARLLSHEFRHVHQYERAGSIAAFLSDYLRQMVTSGYDDAPFEIDARAHESCGARFGV